MKTILFVLFILFSVTVGATDYYVDSSIADTYPSSATPDFTTYNYTTFSTSTGSSNVYKSLEDVNAKSFSANDRVLFRKGQSWYGTIIVRYIGTSHPITYGSFGVGAKPILTGFTTVSAWNSVGTNLWESVGVASSLSSCNMVTINGVPTAMGREPEIGSTYTVDSHSGYTSITSASMGSGTNWTGAKIVNRLIHWTWQVGTISAQSGTTITYSDGTINEPRNGYGFFIQNDVRTLDTQNEWYYNPTTKKIRVYSTTLPTNVKVASVDVGIKSANNGERWYVNIIDLMFTGYNQNAIYAMNFDNVVISGCTFDKIGFSGVSVEGTNIYTITNNTFKNCNWCAVDASPATNVNNYATITSNSIDSSNMILGVNRDFEPAAIKCNSDYALIQYNNIDHTGYNGIYSKYSYHGQIRNNYINRSLLNRSDGGGIYTAYANSDLIIDGNVILNSQGYAVGDGISYLGARGAYLDTGTKYITLTNNVCAYNWEGLYISTSADHTNVSGNTCFDNIASQIHFNFNGATTDPGNDGNTELNTLTNNIFVSKTASYPVALFTSTNNTIPSFLSSASGNIYARPIDDNLTFYIQQPSAIGNKTLAQWKAFSGVDADALGSPFAVTDEADVRFEYNETSVPKTVSLGRNYKEIKTLTDYTSITIAPYSGVVLIAREATPSSNSKQTVSRTNKILRTSSGAYIKTR